MARRRKKAAPSDPMAIAKRRAAERAARAAADQASRRAPERWGVDGAALALPANTEVRTSTDAAGRIARARRADVFDRLHGRGKLSAPALEAVRRLQGDIAILHRTMAGGRTLSPRVDRSPDPEGFAERRLKAGSRIAAALERCGPASARVVKALCEADAALGAPAEWRAVVARESGERLADAQGAILRMACENLAGAYRMVDAEAARRASRAESQAAMAAAGSPVA